MGMTGEQAYVLAKKLIEAGGGGGGTVDAYTKTQTNNLLIQKVDKEVGKGLFSGSYNDLSDTPTIPSKTSELQNDSGYQTEEQVNSAVNELLTENVLGDTGDLSEYEEVVGEITTGKAMYTTGAFYENAYVRYGKFNVSGNKKIRFSGVSQSNDKCPAIAFYESNNTFISSYGEVSTQYKDEETTTPENTSYCIVNSNDGTSTAIVPSVSIEKKKPLKTYVDDEIASISNNALKGKKIVCIGDSIVKGQGYDGGTKGNKSYVDMIAEKNGMTCINYAVSGATLCSGSNTSVFHVCDEIVNMDEDADYIIFGGGINDHNYKTPLGDITEDYTTELSASAIKTILGGVEKCCRELLSRYPTKKILFVFSHKINDTPYTPVTDWSGSGTTHTMTEVHDGIVEVLKKYSIPYVDLFNESRLNTAIDSFKSYTANEDGYHPTKLGYELFYVPMVEQKLKSL